MDSELNKSFVTDYDKKEHACTWSKNDIKKQVINQDFPPPNDPHFHTKP
jgi:hypothetical protein